MNSTALRKFANPLFAGLLLSLTSLLAVAAPTVSLNAPANTSKYLAPATVNVSANATAEAGATITQVAFYANELLIGTDARAPYSVAWTSAPAGSYVLTAIATDSRGAIATSTARSITVNADNTPPTVALTAPANNSKYLTPASLTVSASANGIEVNTPITQVEFYANGTLIGTDTTSPYSIAWANPPTGTYTITAKATDSAGGVTTSTASTVTITANDTPPTVTLGTPANNAKYLAPASLTVSANASGIEVNTPITQVEFYANGTLIGTDTTSPYSIAWANPPTGTHTITAKATDSAGGVTTSTANTVTITASDTPPTVTLGTPANNAKYLAPATVVLTASASGVEANTPISQVEFLDGSTVLATLTTSPYTYAWTTATVGTHSLTARATDSGGAVGTSLARSITITDSNIPPTVALTAPANNSKYLTPASLTISANANGIEVNTPITQVEFYANGTLIGTDTTSPYSISWASPPTGTYTITAKATDSAGGVTTSSASTVTITASDTPPTVTLGTPANNAKYLAPATVTLTASASGVEANTPISQVEFLDGSTVLATLTASPYTFAWTTATVGTHSLTARATDSGGAVGTSAARSITITDTNIPPTVALTAPANNSKYLTPASLTISANANGIEVNTPITQVEFYANGTLIGTDTTSPYSIAWANPPTGTHTITAKATDSAGGVTTSTASTVTITASDTPPTVTLGTPANNAKYLAPTTVMLTASASGVEANTPISQVEFLDGSTVLATLTASPYTFAWTTATVGTHSLTARATDSGGAVGTSAARSITITDTNIPPTVALTAPANNSKYLTPASLTISANANGIEVNTPITQVEFYANGTLIGADATSPYSIAWASPPTGTYTITAKATDSAGGVTTSTASTVTITASDTPPTVTLGTPANNAKYLAPATVTLTASASGVEANTPITQVEFLDGSTVLATLTTSPYTFAWTTATVGTHSITARATDSGGAVGVSTARSITITDTNTPPTVSLTAPINNAMVQVPVDLLVSASVSAPEVNDTVSKVEFYQGSTLIGTATASPWRITWVKPAAGVYTLTAKATDAQGASTTSTSRKVTVLASELLAVSLISPTNNQRFTAPASIPLTARVTDPAGTLARVEFYKGGMLIGSRTAPPYSMALDNVPVGNYSLFAKAIDNDGFETFSAMIAITVTRKVAKIYYLHTDHLNSPRLVTDETNKVVWRNILGEPFGVSPPEEDPDGDGKNFTLNLRFPGQYYDRETNTHYNYRRNYDPMGGRYREFDPIGLAGGINPYAYALSNPLKYTDPLGLDAEMCYRPIQGYVIPGQHCFIRFNGDDKDTSSFDPTGVKPDPAPKGATCEATEGPQADDCVKREMNKCKDYDFLKNNCCHCAEQALKACGQSIPVKKWPNWPINPGPQKGEPSYKP